jgi:hypothetical protein
VSPAPGRRYRAAHPGRFGIRRRWHRRAQCSINHSIIWSTETYWPVQHPIYYFQALLNNLCARRISWPAYSEPLPRSWRNCQDLWMVRLRRHDQAPPHFSVLQLTGGGEPGRGSDGSGCLVAGVNVSDDCRDGLLPNQAMRARTASMAMPCPRRRFPTTQAISAAGSSQLRLGRCPAGPVDSVRSRRDMPVPVAAGEGNKPPTARWPSRSAAEATGHRSARSPDLTGAWSNQRRACFYSSQINMSHYQSGRRDGRSGLPLRPNRPRLTAHCPKQHIVGS